MQNHWKKSLAVPLRITPQAQASYHRYQVSSESVSAARSGYLPTLDFRTGYGYQRLDSPITRDRGGKPPLNQHSFNVHQNSLSLNQNLFSGFSTSHEMERTRGAQSAHKEKLRQTAESLTLEICQAYFSVLNSRQQADISRKNLDVHQRIHDFIEHRTIQGISNQSDLYQIDGRLARAKAEVIKSTNNLKDAESQYIKLINHPPGKLFTPKFDTELLPKSLDEAIDITAKQHPAILAMAHQIQSAEAEYDQTRSPFLPSVDFSVTKRWDKNISGMEGKHDDTMAVVSLSYNLFNGGAHTAKRREAAYRAEESRANQQETYRDVMDKLRQSWAKLEYTQEQEPYLAQHRDASDKTVVAYKKQFDIGKRSLLDLLNSESESYHAEGEYIHTKYKILMAQFEVLACMGQVLNKLRIKIPTSWHLQEQPENT